MSIDLLQGKILKNETRNLIQLVERGDIAELKTALQGLFTVEQFKFMCYLIDTFLNMRDLLSIPYTLKHYNGFLAFFDASDPLGSYEASWVLKEDLPVNITYDLTPNDLDSLRFSYNYFSDEGGDLTIQITEFNRYREPAQWLCMKPFKAFDDEGKPRFLRLGCLDSRSVLDLYSSATESFHPKSNAQESIDFNSSRAVRYFDFDEIFKGITDEKTTPLWEERPTIKLIDKHEPYDVYTLTMYVKDDVKFPCAAFPLLWTVDKDIPYTNFSVHLSTEFMYEYYKVSTNIPPVKSFFLINPQLTTYVSKSPQEQRH